MYLKIPEKNHLPPIFPVFSIAVIPILHIIPLLFLLFLFSLNFSLSTHIQCFCLFPFTYIVQFSQIPSSYTVSYLLSPCLNTGKNAAEFYRRKLYPLWYQVYDHESLGSALPCLVCCYLFQLIFLSTFQDSFTLNSQMDP